MLFFEKDVSLCNEKCCPKINIKIPLLPFLFELPPQQNRKESLLPFSPKQGTNAIPLHTAFTENFQTA